jgi:hypothetical protein
MALLRATTVYDARITALKHPDEPERFSSVLLCTTYDGLPDPYQQFFWGELSFFFLSVALVARDQPPFGITDLNPSQLDAFKACKLALKACEGATDATFAETQAAFRAAIQRLSDALAEDDRRKKDGIIAKTKFELFTEWVNRNDLNYLVGSPPVPGATSTHDLRVPPVLSERSNFLNPAIPQGPFPATLPGR